MSEEKKTCLKCIPRGPVPKSFRKLDYDMLPTNLRFGRDVCDFERSKRMWSRPLQTLPASNSVNSYSERYKPTAGFVYEAVAQNQFVTSLLSSSSLSREGNNTVCHRDREERQANILRNARGGMNLFRGAGKEIAQDPMKSLISSGHIVNKIQGWNANSANTKNRSNTTMYRESMGVEHINDEHVSFIRSFPIKKVAILCIVLVVAYKFSLFKK